jgi:hypothetical protein
MVMTMGGGHATQSQVTTTEDVKACSCGSTRILRAIEQDGDKITSADFLVIPALTSGMTMLDSGGVFEGI